jgi:hypothetical protein
MAKKIVQVIILIVIILSGGYASIRNFLSTISMSSQDAGIDRFEQPLQKLTELVPFQRGTIGYLGDEDIPLMTFDPDDVAAEYMLAQFAVAPLILERGTAQEWNLLNLTSDAYDVWIKENGGKFDVVPLGEHIYLAHRQDQ